MADPTPEQIKFAENRLKAKSRLLERDRAAAPAASVPRKRPLEVTPADSTSPTAPSTRHFASTSGGAAPAHATLRSSSTLQQALAGPSGVSGRSEKARSATPAPRGGLGISVGSTRNYVDYDLSTLKNSKGGFLVAEEEDDERALKQQQIVEDLRKQRLRDLERKGAAGSDPTLTAERDKHARCEICGSVELDFQIHRVFGVAICPKDKQDHPERYSLLTKTECKADYLLTDPELKDEELLPHLLKKNPHSDYSNMMLYLRQQVEDYAFSDKKWGSAEALDAEFERREAEKKQKKGKKFEAKLAELRRKTRTNKWHTRKDEEHVHDFGGPDATVRGPDGSQQQVCVGCGFTVEVEVF